MIPRFVVFDTETTGFTNAARILELGMVFCEEGQVVDSFSQRFNPMGVDWDSSGVQQALEVNGITREELQGQPDFRDVADHIKLLFSRYDIWVAHHISFDLRMISNEFLRINQQLPRVSTVMKVCTLEHSKVIRKRGSHKLEDVAEEYNVKLSNAHTAVGDATATAEIFMAMVEEGKLSPVFMQRLMKVAADEHRWRNPGPIAEQPRGKIPTFSF